MIEKTFFDVVKDALPYVGVALLGGMVHMLRSGALLALAYYRQFDMQRVCRISRSTFTFRGPRRRAGHDGGNRRLSRVLRRPIVICWTGCAGALCTPQRPDRV